MQAEPSFGYAFTTLQLSQVALIHRLDNLHGVLGNSQQAIPVLSHSTMLPAGGSDDQTAKEIIFEAQSQLDKQQKEEHGGVVRGSDAAKVQVTSGPTLPPPPPPRPHSCATVDVVLLYHWPVSAHWQLERYGSQACVDWWMLNACHLFS